MPFLIDNNIEYERPENILGFSAEEIEQAKNDEQGRGFILAMIENHNLLAQGEKEKLNHLLDVIIQVLTGQEEPGVEHNLEAIKANVIDMFQALNRNKLLTDNTVQMVLRSVVIGMSKELKRLIYACGTILAAKKGETSFIDSIAAELENPVTRVNKLTAMAKTATETIGQHKWSRVSQILLAKGSFVEKDDEKESSAAVVGNSDGYDSDVTLESLSTEYMNAALAAADKPPCSMTDEDWQRLLLEEDDDDCYDEIKKAPAEETGNHSYVDEVLTNIDHQKDYLNEAAKQKAAKAERRAEIAKARKDKQNNNLTPAKSGPNR